MEALLTAREAAKRLNVCLKTFSRIVAAGDLPYIRVHEGRRFSPADIDDYIQANKISVPRKPDTRPNP